VWAREHGCPWNTLTCAEAARRGHLEVLEWARAQGCSWEGGLIGFAAQRAAWLDPWSQMG